MNRAIFITCFGDRRKQFEALYRNIRQFTGLPVGVVCDRPELYSHVADATFPVETYWRGSPRFGVRNSNYYKARVAVDTGFDSVCCLDDDMRIVHKDFVQGFALAKKFGVCVPLNPRLYTKHNAQGEDATDRDRRDVAKYGYLPACNLSPMFACAHHRCTTRLLKAFMEELKEHPCRGTLAFAKASWETGITPLYLPEQWCVGRQNAAHIKNYKYRYREKDYPVEPIMLHWGQPEVREVFGEIS